MNSRRVWKEVGAIATTATVVVTVATVAVAQFGVKIPRALFFAFPVSVAGGAVAYAIRRNDQVLPEIQQSATLRDVHSGVQAIQAKLDTWQPVPLESSQDAFIPASPHPTRVSNDSSQQPGFPVDAAQPFEAASILDESPWDYPSADSELDDLLSPPNGRSTY